MNRKSTLSLIGIVVMFGFLSITSSKIHAQCAVGSLNNGVADTVYYSLNGFGCGVFNPISVTVTLYASDVFIFDAPAGDSVRFPGDFTINFVGGGKVLIPAGDSIYVGDDLVIPNGPGRIEVNGGLIISDDVEGATADNVRLTVNGYFESDSFSLDDNSRVNVSGEMVINSDFNVGDEATINISTGGSFSSDSFTAVDELDLDISGDFDVTGDFTVSDEATVEILNTGTFDADNFISDDELILVVTGEMNLDGDLTGEDDVRINVEGTFNGNNISLEDRSDLEVSGNLTLSGDYTATDDAEVLIEAGGQLIAEDLTVGDDLDMNVNGKINLSNDFTVGDDASIISSNSAGQITGNNISGGSDAIPCGSTCPLYGFSSCSPTSFCTAISFSVNNILPVEWLDFDYTLQDEGVLLRWSTAAELNNSHFEIERKVAGLDQDFRTIGRVNGAGNSETVRSYIFKDNQQVIGNVLYRIKQIDFDGAYDYSKTIEVRIDAQALSQTFKNYPNPAKNTLYTFVPAEDIDAEYEMEIRNLQGQRLMYRRITSQNLSQTLDWDISSLPNGLYIVEIKNEKNLHRDKIIKR